MGWEEYIYIYRERNRSALPLIHISGHVTAPAKMGD